MITPIGLGSIGARVERLQRRASAAGRYPWQIDGVCGALTVAAAEVVRRDLGLDWTRTLDEVSAVLGDLVGDGDRRPVATHPTRHMVESLQAVVEAAKRAGWAIGRTTATDEEIAALSVGVGTQAGVVLGGMWRRMQRGEAVTLYLVDGDRLVEESALVVLETAAVRRIGPWSLGVVG